jgi:hypothetical protein
MAIESYDQVSDGRPAAQASQPRRTDKRPPLRDRQDGSCPTDLVNSLTARGDDAL